MQFSTLPQYELGERYSKDRTSSKYKRAARRLRKAGYASEAGKMALQSEVERLNEPTIMRPEHRELEAKEQERLVQMRSPSATSAYDPSQSMADLRGNYFGDIAASRMPASEKAMFANRFDTKLSDMSKQQKAYADLQAAQRKNREDQRVAQLTPQITSRVREIMGSEDSDSNKQKKLVSTMLSPNIAPTLSNSTISSIFTTAATQLKTNKVDKQRFDDLIEKRAGQGDASLVGQASSVKLKEAYAGIAAREGSKETRGDQLKELEDIEGILLKLDEAGAKDPIIRELLAAQNISTEGRDDKDLLIEIIKLLKYPSQETIPEGEMDRLAGMDETKLYREAFGTLLRQKGALSRRAMQEVAAVNPATDAVASSWGQ